MLIKVMNTCLVNIIKSVRERGITTFDAELGRSDINVGLELRLSLVSAWLLSGPLLPSLVTLLSTLVTVRARREDHARMVMVGTALSTAAPAETPPPKRPPPFATAGWSIARLELSSATWPGHEPAAASSTDGEGGT
eukprot:796009-Prorocentrum_minimum.AAC.1